MKVNTLVKHKSRNLGIGCISKILSKHAVVNFGLSSAKKVPFESLIEVDTSKCKTISFREYKDRFLRDNSKLTHCILGNLVKHYVGIGWITSHLVTEKDLELYPRVID